MRKDRVVSMHAFSRRGMLKCAAAGAAAPWLGGAAGRGAEGALARENARAGDPGWQLTYTRVDPATRYRCPLIEGYVSHASIAAGETLSLMVSTNPPAPFTADVYRMGCYGGAGARHMRHLGPLEGAVQPDPEVGRERLRACAWAPCASFAIPEDWLSGVYLIRLSRRDPACESYAVFIVRDARPVDVLVQCSDNTWQAYNRWPDQYSLYDDGESEWALKPGIRVGYDRPYGKYCQVTDSPLTQGSGEFLLWEFPLVYWLEQHGYNVSYCSNTDVHLRPDTLARARGFLSVGHDEYWSLEQFNHLKAAIDGGLNVGFLSANTCCFVAPLEPGPDGRPARTFTRSGRYGGLVPAEVGHMGPFPLDGPNENTLIGARTVSPYNGAGDWTVCDAAHWLFAGTGMKNGDGIPGLVGWEFHGDPAPIPGLQIVAQGDAINASNETAHWTATIYPGPKGNHVFNAATIYWAQGLSSPPGHTLPFAHHGRPHGPDARVQRITRNLLERFLA